MSNTTTTTTKINPGELALANIGLSAILKGEMPRVGLGRLHNMANIAKQIVRLANKVCKGELTYQPYSHEHSYSKLLDRLSQSLTQAEIANLISAFPEEASDIATSFTVEVQQALADLKSIFPVSVYRTFAGPKNLEPNSDVVFKFSNRFDVVNDPLRILPLIATGALLKSQAEIVRQVYPTLSAAIDAAIYEAVARQKAVKQSYQLPSRAEIGVATWFGKRKVDFRPPQSAPVPVTPPVSKLPNLDKTAVQKTIK